MHSPYTGRDVKLPLTEAFKAIPEFFGIRTNEEPVYTVLETVDGIEIRRYGPSWLASVTIDGEFDSFREEAFKRLAAYIFGESVEGERIAMTAPVLQKRERRDEIVGGVPALEQGDGIAWTMSFILPEKYGVKAPPKPLDPKIRLTKVGSRTVAVLSYRGDNTFQKMTTMRLKLDAWLAEHPTYRRVGETFCAQYDAPFVLSPMKRNEVQVEVR